MPSGYDLYQSIVNGIMGGAFPQRGQEQRFPPMSRPTSPYISPIGDTLHRVPGVPDGTPQAPTAPQSNDTMSALDNKMMAGFAKARQQEITARNQEPKPQTPPAAPTGVAPNGTGFQLSPANGGGVLSNAPMPVARPAAESPQLFSLDDGNGMLRQFISRDGQAPNIPGMTATAMGPQNADMGILAKLIRGAF